MWRHESPLMPVLWIALLLVVGGLLLCYDICLLTYATVGVGILLGLGAVFVVGYAAFWLLRNKVSPVIRVSARVVRRHKKNWEISIVGNTPESEMARLGLLGRHRDEAWKAYSREMARGDVPELDIAAGADYLVPSV